MLLRKMKLFKWFVRNLSLLLALFMSDGIIAISQISFPHLIPPIVCILKPSITDFENDAKNLAVSAINCWFNHFSSPPSDKILPSHFVPHHAVVICEQQNMILMDQFAKVYFWTPLLINKDPPAPHHAPYTYEEHHPENLGAEAGLNRSLFLRQNPPNVHLLFHPY